MVTTIRVDYNQARAQAKKLQQASSECENVVRRLQMAQNRIGDCWEGAAATAYAAAIQKRIQEIKKLGADIETQALQIRRVADEFERAERRLKEMMRQ